MSHSRIFKVQSDLSKDFERLREEDYYDNGFLDSVGDYVSENTDTKEDYEWLASCTMSEVYTVRFEGTVELDEGYGDGTISMPLAYLDIDVDKTKQYIDERLADYAEKVAEDPYFALSYEGETMIKGDFGGFYIEEDGWGYTTLFRFLIHVVKLHKTGTVTYRLEGSLDYHM